MTGTVTPLRRWVGLDDALRVEPRPRRDDTHQAELRRAAGEMTGPAAFYAILYENRDPRAEGWRSRAACATPENRLLFFPNPKHADAEAGSVTSEDGRVYQRPATVEPGRAERLEQVRKVCVSCPVYHECLGWRLRVAGADKVSIAANIAWNTVKITLASTRRVALERAAGRGQHPPTVTGRDLPRGSVACG